MEPCTSSDCLNSFQNRLVFLPHLLFGLEDFSLNQLFGFPPPSPVWVGRFFIKSTKSGCSLLLSDSPYQSLVFFFSYPIGLKYFSSIIFHRSFSFLPQFFHWVGRFFIDQSLLYHFHCPPRARSLILRNLVFPPHLLIYKQEVFSTIPQIGYTTSAAMLIATRSSELAPKKEGNCNAVAIKITWLHLSTGIPPSPRTPFIYCLISTGLFPDIPNLIYLLSGIGFSTLHYWKAHQPLSSAVILQSSHLLGILPTVILLYWDSVFLFRLLCLFLCLISVYYRMIVWVKPKISSNVAWAYPALK